MWEAMTFVICLSILNNLYCRNCFAVTGIGKKSGRVEMGECDSVRHMHPQRW